MDNGSSSEAFTKSRRQRRGGQEAPAPPKIESFVPKKGYTPDELKSWAKRTGFVSTFSSEISNASVGDVNVQSDRIGGNVGRDLEKGLEGRVTSNSPKIELDPVLGRARGGEVDNRRGFEIEPDVGRIGRDGNFGVEDTKRRIGAELDRIITQDDPRIYVNGNGNDLNRNEQRVAPNAPVKEDEKKDEFKEVVVNGSPSGSGEPGPAEAQNPSTMKCGIRDNPRFALAACYGLQHYISLAGSLIFIPVLMVPAMGGTDKDTATVISTMLFVSGITTLLHSFFGTRLPLVQGSSFIYLAPALVIMNSEYYRNLTEHRFRHIMRELQGAIIVGSLFQSFIGLTGLMSLLLRLINPIVVAPTVAAVGLAFFSYGFPQAGNCVELSVPQVGLVLIFALYLRRISIFGHRVFRIYSVTLSFLIVWVYAFILTTGGAYNYKGCSTDIPSSNILVDGCRRHAFTMRQCRTDASNAWRAADWVRVPYPLQWGIPIFHLRTSVIMIIVSLVASVDSVGTYHCVSVKVAPRPPTPWIVSRGIGLEGVCSVLAGLWGTGTGSTTLTENIHTINATKIANRKTVQLGATFLIFISLIGKVGAIFASVPVAVAAAVLCFIWALTVALGLMNLQYCQTSSFRNMIIVGVSLFFGLSVPAYFQQYQPDTSLVLPGYLIPYAAASSGPVKSGNEQIDFILNALLSMNMVVTLLIAFLLDNTVPGTRDERGAYVWSRADDLGSDPEHIAPYALPSKLSCLCCWPRSRTRQPQPSEPAPQ
uniref:Nucleobase-ascorbate transporter 11 n=1 Tax=Kalanchoe fedtschenkoi TaxID=63787 RepID=A0A7N0TU06_KALFE